MKNNIDKILTKLADSGYLISQQRRIIIKVICREQHISRVDDLWVEIRKNHSISVATVYTTIRILTHIGCLIPVTENTHHQRYDLIIPK